MKPYQLIIEDSKVFVKDASEVDGPSAPQITLLERGDGAIRVEASSLACVQKLGVMGWKNLYDPKAIHLRQERISLTLLAGSHYRLQQGKKAWQFFSKSPKSLTLWHSVKKFHGKSFVLSFSFHVLFFLSLGTYTFFNNSADALLGSDKIKKGSKGAVTFNSDNLENGAQTQQENTIYLESPMIYPIPDSEFKKISKKEQSVFESLLQAVGVRPSGSKRSTANPRPNPTPNSSVGTQNAQVNEDLEKHLQSTEVPKIIESKNEDKKIDHAELRQKVSGLEHSFQKHYYKALKNYPSLSISVTYQWVVAEDGTIKQVDFSVRGQYTRDSWEQFKKDLTKQILGFSVGKNYAGYVLKGELLFFQ